MESKISLFENISTKNSQLNKEIARFQNELKAEVDEKQEIEKRICILQSANEQEKSSLEKQVQDLESSKESILKSKIGLQNDLEDANARTNILKQEIEKVKGQSRKTEDKLQSELSNIKTEMVGIFACIN